jgi:hypothetical protein
MLQILGEREKIRGIEYCTFGSKINESGKHEKPHSDLSQKYAYTNKCAASEIPQGKDGQLVHATANACYMKEKHSTQVVFLSKWKKKLVCM